MVGMGQAESIGEENVGPVSILSSIVMIQPVPTVTISFSAFPAELPQISCRSTGKRDKTTHGRCVGDRWAGSCRRIH
jgi:hypothetical protein